MKAPINNIIPFSNVDGPGNRTSIFFQGCPFKCLYCHNPETINICNNCSVCVKHCPENALLVVDGKVMWNKNKCVNCDTCINVCPNLSSPKITYYTVEELIEEINKFTQFIRGITVSGGECMMHGEFITMLFKECRNNGLDCLLDSNGHYDFKEYQELLSYSDGVMLDIKSMDNKFHELIVKAQNKNVIENLKYLQSIDKLYEVRTVLLPNNPLQNESTIIELSKILKPNIRVKLIKYRPFGVRNDGLKEFGNIITSDEEIERVKNIALKNGLENIG